MLSLVPLSSPLSSPHSTWLGVTSILDFPRCPYLWLCLPHISNTLLLQHTLASQLSFPFSSFFTLLCNFSGAFLVTTTTVKLLKGQYKMCKWSNNPDASCMLNICMDVHACAGYFYVSVTRRQLELSERRDPQLNKHPPRMGLWTSLWSLS